MPELLPPAKEWKNKVFARLTDSIPRTINVNEPLSGLFYSNGVQWYKVELPSSTTPSLEQVRTVSNQIDGDIDFNLFTGVNVRDPVDVLELVNLQTLTSNLDLYLKLAGRSGGQVAYGGTLAGNDLTLSGTSHATVGDVIVNPGGGSLLVGTSTNQGFVAELAGVAAANVAILGMFSSGLTNGQRIFWAFGKTPANSNAFSILYNHNSTDSSRYLSFSSYEGSTGIITIFASGAANYGTITIGGTTQHDRLTVFNDGTNPYAIRFGFTGTHHWRFGLGPDSGTRYMKIYSGASTSDILSIDSAGRIGWIIGGMTAFLHLKAGTTAASTAPMKWESGPLLTAPEIGAMEFLTDKWYGTITTGTARKEITLNDITLTPDRVPFITTNGRLTDSVNMVFDGSKFDLQAGKFTVDANGDMIKIKDVTYSWPSSQGAADTYLKNDGSGNLTWSA